MDPAPAHSDIGASTMARLMACAGSFRLSQQVRAHTGATTTIYAATGTVAHALIEDAVTQGYDPATQLGEVVAVDGHTVTVTADMIEGVQVCVDEYARRGAGATHSALETRVELDDYWLPGKPPVPAFGTADFWAYHGATLHLDVVDYKNGAGIYVDVHENPQLYYYAAGVLLVLASRGLPPPITIDLTVVQPNIYGQDKVRTFHTTTLDTLIWVDDTLLPTVARLLVPQASLASGPHCKFCPARAACPALARLAQELARRDFGPSAEAPRELSPAELAQVLRDQDAVSVHVQALREVAMENLSSGVPVPGWRLTPSRPMRTWTQPGDKLLDTLAAAGHPRELLETLVYAPREVRSPAQMERALTPAQFALIETHIQSKSSGVRLVPDLFDPSGGSSGSTRATPQDDFA